jgi:hypothetical protein
MRRRDATMLPSPTSNSTSVSRANRGDLAGAHDELPYGLQRAEAARDDGEAWGAELVGRWTRALERYAERWGIGRA